MENICEKLTYYRNQLPPGGILVAVSKTKTPEIIRQAYACGHRDFGENKVQELRAKHQVLPADIRWHMIGHLQTNKVKYIAPFIWLIHSVDSEKLLHEIDRQAAKHHRVIPVLFQIKIAQEQTKYGMDEEVYHSVLRKYIEGHFPHVSLRGLMGMATFSDDRKQVRNEFAHLAKLYHELKKMLPGIAYLSMGMTGDYSEALAEGANIIRIGSGIFGARN